MTYGRLSISEWQGDHRCPTDLNGTVGAGRPMCSDLPTRTALGAFFLTLEHEVLLVATPPHAVRCVAPCSPGATICATPGVVTARPRRWCGQWSVLTVEPGAPRRRRRRPASSRPGRGTGDDQSQAVCRPRRAARRGRPAPVAGQPVPRWRTRSPPGHHAPRCRGGHGPGRALAAGFLRIRAGWARTTT